MQHVKFFKHILFFSFILFSMALYSQPIVTGISPVSGPPAGGQTVMINGSGFTGATNVFFGPNPATTFTVLNDTLISATSPASVPIVVDITVVDTGTSAITQFDRYAYAVGDWLAFIPDFGSNHLFVSNTSTELLFPNPIPVGSQPNDVCVTQDSRTAYSVNSGSGTLTSIDVTTLTPGVTIPTDSSFPILMALTPDPAFGGDNIGYTANYSSNSVSQIDLTTGNVLNIIPVGSNPTGCAVYLDFSTNPPTPKAVYVVNSGSSNITVISLPTLTTSTINTGPGSIPSFILITPGGTTAYFSDDNPSANSIRQLLNVDTNAPTLGYTLTDPSFNFNGANLFPEISIDPASDTLYVTNTGLNTISPVNIGTSPPSVTCPPVVVEGAPDGIVFIPDGSKLYVSNSTSNAISIISGLPSCGAPPVSNLIVGTTPTDPTITPDQAPLAYFIFSPNPGGTGVPVSFDPSASISPIGSIVSYAWDFGDGNQQTTFPPNPMVTHTYASPGTYNVTLTVTNSAGTSTYSSSLYNGKRFLRNGGPAAQFMLPVLIILSPPAPTTTTLNTAPNPSNLGELVTFSATVTSNAGTPTGSVQFFVDGATYGAPVGLDAGGNASITDSALTGGTHAITAHYLPTGDFSGSISNQVNQVVNKDSTTTDVTSDVNPSEFGEQITFTATVIASNPGVSGIPTGVVQFIDNSTTPITIFGTGTLDGSGVATFQTPLTVLFTVGNHNVTASYLGDANHIPSTSAIYVQVVDPATTTTIVNSSPNPSQYGESVTLTAHVSPIFSAAGVATGTVQFYISGVPLGSPVGLDSSGNASISTLMFPVGVSNIQADYTSNSTNFNDSIGTNTQTVGLADTTTVVTSLPNPSIYGQNVILTATVSSNMGFGVPAGTIQFIINGVNYGSPVALVNGVATTSISTLSVGSNSIQANYSGDSTFNPSSGTTTQTVNQATTTTAVVDTPNPSTVGETVTLTATVTPQFLAGGLPTGTIQFVFNGTNVGSPVTLVNGQASTTFVTNTAGSFPVVAMYSGDSNYSSSSGNTTQGVGANVTVTTVTSSINPSTYGQNVVFTATIASLAGTPTGTVQFLVDGTPVGGAVPVVGGQAAFAIFTLSVATHTIEAQYTATGIFSDSNGSIQQLVDPAPTTTTVSSTPNPSMFGQTVSLNTTVTSANGLLPNGNVQFVIDGTNYGSPIALDGNGNASTTISTLGIGGHSVEVIYFGNSNFSPSNGTTTQTVGLANTITTVSSLPNPSIYSQTVTLTADVNTTLGAPVGGGNVQFIVNGAPFGAPIPVIGGTASTTISNLPAGSNAIEADYSGNVDFNPSTGTNTQIVDKATTNTVVFGVPNPSFFGQNVVFTATVIPEFGSLGGGFPTGTIQFTVDGINLGSPVPLDVNGMAVINTSMLSVGSHSVQAIYLGDSNFDGSVGTTTQQVNPDATKTTVTSTPNPSVTGEVVNLSANVTSLVGIPNGFVQFKVDGVDVGAPVALNSSGVAALSTPIFTTGSHAIEADYLGNSDFLPSSGTSTQTVNSATTITTVVDTPNPSTVGETVTLTATVTPQFSGGVLTGTIQFVFNGTNVGSPVTLVNGQASTTFVTNTAGSFPVVAMYSGDSNYSSSSGNTTQGVGANVTVTTVTSSINPSTYGQNVVFTATIASLVGTPTGNVQFLVDGTPVGGAVPVVGGQAAFAISTLFASMHIIEAQYTATGIFSDSNGSIQQLVNPASTTTTVSSTPNPSMLGQTVTINTTVTSSNGLIPNGNVQFIINGTNYGSPIALDGSGNASTTISILGIGGHPVQVLYLGNSNFNPSNGSTMQTVGAASTITTVISTPNPSVTGELVNLSAFVSSLAGIPNGSVQFKVDGVNVGVASLNLTGEAVLNTPIFTTGSHTIEADYLGNMDFLPSSDITTQIVNPATTTTTVVDIPNPSTVGDTVILTASVTHEFSGGGFPTGTIQFVFNGTNVGSPVTLVNGHASTTYVTNTVGSFPVVAMYSGDSNYAASSGNTMQGVGANVTVTTVTSSINPSTYGQNVVFTVTITSLVGTPTGNVQFLVDGTPVGGAVPVVGGQAAFAISTLSSGMHTIEAQYTATGIFSDSNGSIQQLVDPAPTMTIVISTPNPSITGELVTLSAHVSFLIGTPNGFVQFKVDGVNVGVAPLNSSGEAVLSTPIFTTGSHTIEAEYLGNINFFPSSDTTTQTTNPDPTSMILTSSSPVFAIGEKVTFTATVIANVPGSGIPTGTVSFYDGTTLLGVETLVGGVATLSTSSLTFGSHTIRAVYSGDANYLSSFTQLTEESVAIFPPTHLKVTQKKNKFATQTDFVNIITFEPPLNGERPAFYKIYRTQYLKREIARISAKRGEELSGITKFRYEDHNRKKNHSYTYFIVSVDEFGNVSSPAKVTYKP